MLVGVIGKSGAGKTAISEYFGKKGFFVIDGDGVAHNCMKAGCILVSHLAQAFGSEILDNEGNINRSVLSKIVFSDTSKLQQLNSISHKFICEEFDEMAKGHDKVLIDAAALVESGYTKKCDYVIAVVADSDTRLSRIMSRDGIDRQTAQLRINAQREDKFYTDNADFVVINDGKMDLNSQLDGIYNKLI